MNTIPDQRHSPVKWPDQIRELPDIQDNGGLYLGGAVFYPERERIAAFIDGPNVYATIRQLNAQLALDEKVELSAFVRDDNSLSLDYKKLLNLLTRLGIFVKASYYTAINADDGYQTVKPLTDWLDYNGYNVVTKLSKTFESQDGRSKVKGNMDCDLVVDVMTAVYDGAIDHVILFSGDGDFKSLIEACQRRRARVTVVSSMATRPVMIADELRRQASQFLDLYSIFPMFQKVKSEDHAQDSSVIFREPIRRPPPMDDEQISA